MTQLDYESPRSQALRHRAGLIAWGVVMLVAAVLTLMVTVYFFYLAALAMVNAGLQKDSVSPELLFYRVANFASVTVALYLMGTASCRGLRWIRPVMIVVSILMALNVISVIVSTAVSIVRLLVSPGGQLVRKFFYVQVTSGVVVGVVGFGVAGSIFWFYSRVSVQTTLDQLDPSIRWTDRFSLPALAWCLALLSIALNVVTRGVNGFFPIGTEVVTGDLAIEATASIAVILILAAVLSIRQSMLGWLLGLITTLALSVSYFMFQFAGNTAALYNQIHPSAHLGGNSELTLPIGQILLPAILYATAFAYGLWVGRQLMEKQL